MIKIQHSKILRFVNQSKIHIIILFYRLCSWSSPQMIDFIGWTSCLGKLWIEILRSLWKVILLFFKTQNQSGSWNADKLFLPSPGLILTNNFLENIFMRRIINSDDLWWKHSIFLYYLVDIYRHKTAICQPIK